MSTRLSKEREEVGGAPYVPVKAAIDKYINTLMRKMHTPTHTTNHLGQKDAFAACTSCSIYTCDLFQIVPCIPQRLYPTIQADGAEMRLPSIRR